MRRPFFRQAAGFTMVELVLAIGLSSILLVILASCIHVLIVTNGIQAGQQKGIYAMHDALRVLMRDAGSAFLPPVEDLEPFRLEVSRDPLLPETLLAFYAPVPDDQLPSPHAYDIAQITHIIRQHSSRQREWLRITTPCSGPYTNTPQTNLLFRGAFRFSAQVLEKGQVLHEAWPLLLGATNLPPALRITCTLDGEDPVTTDVLIQAAHGIRSRHPDVAPAE